MAWKLPLPAMPQRVPDFDPPDVTPAWLVRAFKTAANMFMVVCIAVVWMRCLDVARENSVPLIITHAGWWVGNVEIWFPLFAPLVVAAIALPWTAKIIIPAFCTFSWSAPRQWWPKFWCALLTVLLAMVIMTAAFPLYHKAYNERFKDEATRVEQVDMGRAALQANLDSINADLKDISNPALTTYQAQAAREGATAWAKRVATAKAQNDYQADAIERALAAAERGDQLRADRSKAIQALAAAPTKASAMEQVSSGNKLSAQGMVDFLEEWWAFALFAVVELMALIAGWVAYMMEMVRTRQLADYEASQAKDAEKTDWLQISDQTDKPAVMPQETILEEDPETGELVEKIRVRYKNEDYFRKKPSPRKPKAAKPDSRAPVIDPIAEPEQIASDGTSENIPSADSERETEEAPSELWSGAPEEVETTSEPMGAGPGELDAQEYQQDNGTDDRADADNISRPDLLEDEQLDAAPLETPDEPITWDEIPEESEPQASVQISDAEALELEAEYQRIRHKGLGLPAPSEAAE